MARGDIQYRRSRSTGGGSSYDYDDEGRGTSKTLFEEFSRLFEASGYSEDWLLNIRGAENVQDMAIGLYDARLYHYIHNMTWRYNIHDWAFNKFEDPSNNDGRVRRLVIKKCGVPTWLLFQEHAHRIWERQRELDEQVSADRSERHEHEMAAHKAKRIKRQTDEVVSVKKAAQLISGALQADFQHAFSSEEVYDLREGDWLDDPVMGYATGYGFAEEVRKPSGIKLQITVSIDMSNSMYYNKVDKVAAIAFRDLYLALEQLKDEHPNDLFICAFTFSKNGYSENNKGRNVNNLTINKWYGKDPEIRHSTEESLGAVRMFGEVEGYHSFDGEDTWFYPLFTKIEEWEDEFSDSGALKLDIILTDAVIEHPTDIRRSDVIQERRDGTLHTVMLNFLPEGEWVNSDLPMKCVQYHADPEDLGGLLRNIISEFVNVYL